MRLHFHNVLRLNDTCGRTAMHTHEDAQPAVPRSALLEVSCYISGLMLHRQAMKQELYYQPYITLEEKTEEDN